MSENLQSKLRRLAKLSCCVLASAVFPGSLALAEPPEIGLWFDDTGRGAVQIEPCGDRLCGHIAWLEKETNADGKPLRDKHNPEADMRNRLICGIQVLGNLAPMSDGSWGAGWVYDPKVGKSYDVEIKLADPNTLIVFGYAGVKLFGKTLPPWKRAPADLPKCNTTRSASGS